MADRSELLKLADEVIVSSELDKSIVLNYVQKFHANTDALGIGGREVVAGACKKVIEWLSNQDLKSLEKKDWFPIVNNLCTHDTNSDEEKETRRINMNLLIENNVVLRLIQMCFSEDEPLDKDETTIDFKDWYGRISLLCSFLEIRWERLSVNEANALRYCASTNLRMIPNISAESEKIFIRSILRVVNRIMQITSVYEGQQQFCKSIVDIYTQIIRETADARDQEYIVTSLITNLNELNESENSKEIMLLLWEMLMGMCSRLRDGGKEGFKERKNISPHADFHKSLDSWLSNFVHATIQDSLEEKILKREEICNWIVSTLTSCTYTISPPFEEFTKVLATFLSVTHDQIAPLSSSFARLYSRLNMANAFDLDQQKELVDILFNSRVPSNEIGVLAVLRKIMKGDSSHSLSLRIANVIIEKDETKWNGKGKKIHLILVDCMEFIPMKDRSDLGKIIVKKMNEIDFERKGEGEGRLVDRLIQLNIVFGKRKKSEEKEKGMKIEKIVDDSDLSHFNSLLSSEEYTRMMEVCMQAYYGMERKDYVEQLFLPPINVEYGRRIVNGEKLLSYHHMHYFHLHSALSKSKQYMDFVIGVNGSVNMEPLLVEMSSLSMIDRMMNSMLKLIISMREQYPLPLASRYNDTLGYMVDSLSDGTIPSLSSSTLKLVTSATTSVELRYVLSEFSIKPNEREEVRPRMLKLIQIAKCSLLSHEERTRLLDGVNGEVHKAISSLLSAYKEEPELLGSLHLQNRLISILRHHVDSKDISPSTISFINLYLMERCSLNTQSSFQSLITLLILSLCESPTLKYQMESGMKHSHSPISPFITSPLMDRFTRLFLSLFSSNDSKFLPTIEWSKLDMNIPYNYLNCIGDASRGMEASLPLIALLSKIIQGDGMREEARCLILSYLDQYGPSFVLRVMRCSPCRPVFFYQLFPIIDYLREKEEIRSEVDDMLVECVPLLLSNPISEMLTFYPITLQSTDRYAQTQLNWRSQKYLPSDEKERSIDPILESFVFLAKHSTFKRLIFTMCDNLGTKMEEWLANVHDAAMVLRGVTYDVTAQVVWKVQLISQGFGYMSVLAEEARKKGRKREEAEEEEYLSDEEENNEKHFLLENREEEVRSVCTFVSTSKEFTKQHWYNCYTCKMTDSEGVCTVCALNCHRGHDISYSKLGSFFCDCGAKKCRSLKEAEKKRPLKRGKRMKEVKKEEKYIPTINLPIDITREEVKKYLVKTQKVMELYSSSVNSMMTGVETAYEGKFKIEGRRGMAKTSWKECVYKYDECIMVGSIVENEGFEQLDRRAEAIDGPPGNRRDSNEMKECSAIVRLNDGSTLFLHVNEKTTYLSLIYMAASTENSLGETRVEREALPFAPKRITVKGDHIAITGLLELAFLRVSLDSGDIIQKDTMRITTTTNPIVKAAWSIDEDDKENTILGVATQQHVRIYSVHKDMERHDVELVLPMGILLDIDFIRKSDADYTWLVVLSAPSHLYYHQLGGPGPNYIDETRSLYLTNTLPLPVQINAISLHYSTMTEMLFVSFLSGLYCARIDNGDIMEVNADRFNKLEMDGVDAWVGWNESYGVIAALSQNNTSNKVLFVYPTLSETMNVQMLIQVATLPQTGQSISLAPSPSFESIMGIALLSGYRRPAMLFTSNWTNEPDLWMDHRQMRMDKIAMIEEEDENEEMSEESMVTVFENGMEIRDVEMMSVAMEEYYSTDDLTMRLKNDKMNVVSINRDEVDITIRVTKRYYEVKGLRLEVEGASGPKSVSYNGKEMILSRRVKSIYDIPLSNKDIINFERPLTLTLKCKEGGVPTCISSIRAFGDSREDLFARCLTYPPLSLPYQCVLNSLRFVYELLEYQLEVPTRLPTEKTGEMSEWLIDSPLRVISPRTCRPSLTMIAKKILRKYLKGDLSKYYHIKDREVIESLAKFHRSGHHIAPPVLRSYLSLLKHMADTRYDNLVLYTEQSFGDVLSLCGFLRCEMGSLVGDDATLNILVTSYLHLSCSFLSNDHPSSRLIIQQIIGVVTSQKTFRVWMKYREELRVIVRDSIDGCGLKNGEWIKRLIRMILTKIRTEMEMPMPIWWRRPEERKEEKVDSKFQRSINGMNALIGVGAMIMREMEGEEIVEMMSEMVDELDVMGVMSEENEYRVKSVRIGGVIGLINAVCTRRERRRPKGERIEDGEREEIVDEERRKKDEADEEIQDMFNHIVYPLLANETRREKLLLLNFRLMEESLKFLMGLKDGQRMESGWHVHGGMVGVSTSDCLLEYYLAIARSSLNFPTLFLLPQPPIIILNEDRKNIICEFLLVDSRITLRKNAKKLLYQACNCDKKKYYDTKNEYMIMRNLNILRFNYLTKFWYTHEDSTTMMEVISRVRELVGEKNDCWRKMCEANLPWILLLTTKVIEPVGTAILELIQSATKMKIEESVERRSQPPLSPDLYSIGDTLIEGVETRNLLKVLIVKYLLGREESRRWLMHSLCRSIMQFAKRSNQIIFCDLLYNEILPLSRRVGERGAQLTDLISAYIPTLLPSSNLVTLAQSELIHLQTMIQRLESSEEKSAVNWLVEAGMGWRDALYLSPDPCIDCLRPNTTMEAMKISTIKTEGRFTTSALMYKLDGHYEINKISIKLTDIKKTRMFRRVNAYYTMKSIESAVELKSDREKWKIVSTAIVDPSEAEINMTVAIPIVTNAIVIELTDVIDLRTNMEVHCPRCSNVVRSATGVCEQCGESADQCVKCRMINYDEKEPFLCASCGYCKYARMDVIVWGRMQPTMVIAPDNDRPMACRASKAMNKLQWDMDMKRGYLRTNAALIQSLSITHRLIPVISFGVDGKLTMEPVTPHLAQLAPSDDRRAALSECMTRIRVTSNALVSQSLQLVSIREAMRKMEQVYSPCAHLTTQLGFSNGSERGCIGCLTASIIHSISILRALSDDYNVATILTSSELIYNDLVVTSRPIEGMRNEVESLMIRLCQSEKGVDRLCELVKNGRMSPVVMGHSLIDIKGMKWNERMDTLLEVARRSEDDDMAQIALLNVLIETMREGKKVIEKIERREKMKRFMREKGPSTSKKRKDEEKEDGDDDHEWTVVDAILNDKKNEMEVDEIEEKRQEMKSVGDFLWTLVFSRSIFVRSLAAKLMRMMMGIRGQLGSAVSTCMAGLQYGRLCDDSVRCDQFFLAFNCLMERGQVKLRLFQANFHLHLIGLILSESKKVYGWERSDESVSASSGRFISHCTNLLTNLLSGSSLECLLLSSARLSLLVPLLHSFILLTRVTIKRNRPINESIHQLESLLRRCTAKEGLSLLAASVSCLKQLKDEKSRADMVGVILETLDPRENESNEFTIQVEKDAAQEDFLQGRMQHNPYKSGDASMGPLMRNIKDKICRESELIALLDDDNGMELLVNSRIISLALPVKLVYEKVWKPFHPGEPMVIVYRMRGLLGDAVEPFVETIDENSEGEGVGDEETRLLSAFLDSNGVSTTLSLLQSCSLSPNGCLLLVQLRKLLMHMLKVDKMRNALLNCGGVSVLLGVVKRMRGLGMDADQSIYAAQVDLFKIIDSLVSDPNNHPILKGLSGEETDWLLSLLNEYESRDEKRNEKKQSQLIEQVTKMLANAVLGSEESEMILVRKLKEGLAWEELMVERRENPSLSEELRRLQRIRIRKVEIMDRVERRADAFTLIVDGIQSTQKGMALKGRLIDAGVIEDAVNALLFMHPPLYGTVESPEWKTYLARPALKLILRLLKGMAKGDERSQMEIAKKALPILHRLEQVSSAEHLGTIAETVMEELSHNKVVAAEIDRVREETKQKKRQMAMAMREKQLSKLGMTMGRGGETIQFTHSMSSRSIANEPEVGESCDPLTSCCICRESILTGSRVPATYAHAVPYRWPQDSVPTHSSTSLSVMVHVDCHFNAIRRSNGGRNADEWTKAALHNSGARCNIVVPIPLAEPSITDWNSALNRLQGDLEGIVPGAGQINRYRVFIDMCNLIRKFILNRSFSENAGGGGRESNMQYLGILHLLALHLPEGDLPCTMASERLNSFLVTELSVSHWNEERMDVLRAFLRDILIGEVKGVARDSVLREGLLQWTFIDLYFNRVIPMEGDDRLKWLQSNFGETLKRTVELVKHFDTTLLPVKTNEDLAAIIGVDMQDALSLSTVTTPE